jgi:hypothetical protein
MSERKVELGKAFIGIFDVRFPQDASKRHSAFGGGQSEAH